MDFIRIPENPVPEGAELSEITRPDGIKLRVAYFPAPDARGTVILQAGRCEYIEKYFEVIEELRSRKFNVATMDWRGQGLSSRLLPDSIKGHIDDFNTYKEDLKTFIVDHTANRFPGPYVLMTHSMGGMPALMLLAEGFEKIKCAVLCAPMTKFYLTKSMQAYTKIASNLACMTGFGNAAVIGIKEDSLAFEGNNLTSDPVRHERFFQIQLANQNACVHAPTYGWISAGVKAIDSIHQDGALNIIQCPVKIISAEKDSLVSTDDHAWLAAQYPQISQVTIKGALHEIMMERDQFRQEFWKEVDGFLETALSENTEA